MTTMHDEIITRLGQRFEAYEDLAASLDDELLTEKIDVPKHKSLAEHLWCVVGARESYAKAFEQGEWTGFSCSLNSFAPDDFREKLQSSANAVNLVTNNVVEWTPQRNALLAALAEHEVMHEGQIIRHMYALQKELPESWVWA